MAEGMALHELVIGPDGTPEDYVILDANPSFERITGIARSQAVGRRASELYGTGTPPYLDVYARVTLGGGPEMFETFFAPMDKAFSIHAYATEAGRFATVFEDATARRQAEEEKAALEEQLRQAMKMEAVGRLAGGVAHDFNNILTGILGYADLLLRSLPPEDPSRAEIREIASAGERAADLTRQLLAFSRKQLIAPKVLDLNEVLANSQRMLTRIIGEDVRLLFVPGENLGRVRADPGQIEQVLINLAVNARDAMPDGGTLTVETADAVIDAAYARTQVGVTPGVYVRLAVSDSGHGMTPEVKAHLFEPFFTTKEKGKGTGLGLSTVYGIVRQNGGFVHVYSEPGRGSTFRIYFPRVEDAADALPLTAPPTAPRGTETILLVEDEEMVRRLVARVLGELGYRILTAADGGEAQSVSGAEPGRIDLLLTDVIMPGMNGKELFAHLAVARPGLRTLFMSGYTENAIAHHGVLDPGTRFLPKPFTIEHLAAKVREALDG
jgi:signal transduction histidine kinase